MRPVNGHQKLTHLGHQEMTHPAVSATEIFTVRWAPSPRPAGYV